MRKLILMMGIFAAAFSAQAQEEDDIPPSPIVKTELLADVPAQRNDHPGRDIIGVRFTIPKGWHIYWKNPGDSGIPTKISWHLPKGVTVGDLEWPIPEAIAYEGLTNYGYSNEVLLGATVSSARGRPTGTVTAKANWLVCKDICIPESATLTAELPTVTPSAVERFVHTGDALPYGTDSSIAYYSVTDTHVKLVISAWLGDGPIRNLRWFPLNDGVIQNNAKQSSTVTKEEKNYSTVTLTIPKGSVPVPEEYDGLLVFENDKGKDATFITAVSAPSSMSESTVPASSDVALLTLLGLALLGGLILNIMPCVLPILALKALAITKKAGVSRKEAARQGVAYTVGVIGSFLLIAAGMLALKASGNVVGWGFQLQHASFVAVLAIVMVLVAANLLGLFELPVLFGSRATQIDDSTVRGSFFTGVLAVLVATPCTAPFMATAIGATLTLSSGAALSVFAALGLGMALPFLLISIWPAARRLLPKPGPWMKRFKQLLAIPMLATAAWLIWVFVQLQSPTGTKEMSGHEAYSATRLADLRKTGTPVLLDATADWCLTCKINERIAINTPAMQAFFSEKKVVLMVADWTASDPEITKLLSSFGRAGVPLYVYYPPHGEPVVLPQILTPASVREAISKH